MSTRIVDDTEVVSAINLNGMKSGYTSLSEKAYAAILQMLINLTISPGAPINEGRLAEQLQMGRTPVREAIKRLEAEGLVITYPRRGIFATQVHLSDLDLLAEVRVHLEGEAAFQAARRSSRDDRRLLKELLEEANAPASDITAEIDFDRRVHHVIYAAAHNPYLAATSEQYHNLAIRIWHVWSDRLPEMASHISELIPLLQRIHDGDAAQARELATQHVIRFQQAIAMYS